MNINGLDKKTLKPKWPWLKWIIGRTLKKHTEFDLIRCGTNLPYSYVS